MPDFKDIQSAAERIAPYIHRTPVMTSQAIDELSDCRLYFKCENLQKTGSFKIRGATNAVFSLAAEQAARGVATHSSGNHGAALARAARIKNINCYVVTPHNAPEIKKKAMLQYGAEIRYSEATLASRTQLTEQLIEQTGAVLIHPFDNENIIAGAGTSTVELIAETGHLDYLFVPVGGGGCISGCAIAAKNLLPSVKVMGAEPLLADDARHSLESGQLQPPREPRTVADGLRTALCDRTFRIIQQYVDDIMLVDDDEIMQAMRLIWERMKIIVEPSGAVGLAAVLKNKKMFSGKKAGIILTGGNVDLQEVLTLL